MRPQRHDKELVNMFIKITRAGIALAVLMLAAGMAVAMPVIDEVSPPRQRVYERVKLTGSGFGAYQPGVSRVVFSAPGGGAATVAGLPYVWRDDYIEIRVPVGGPSGPVAKGPVNVTVINAQGISNPGGLQIIFVPGGTGLDFFEKTRLVNNAEVSGVFGDEDFNKARTKDADVGDINNDGYPDIIDNNSNNQGNNTHEVVRLNRLGLFFGAINFEPVDMADTDGPFLTTVPQVGGNYVGDAVAYDGDWVDLNNDGFLDWVQAASRVNAQVRVAINNFLDVPGRFLESTNTWLVNPNYPSSSPDDIGHADINFDGFVDVVAAFRFSSSAQVYLNDNGATFSPTITTTAQSGSMHDAFFTDYNGDGSYDVVLVNESGNSALFRNNGNLPVPGFTADGTISEAGFAGAAADLTGNGLDDLIISGSNSSASVFINDPQNPGNFTERVLPDAEQFTYDMEPADIDLDGDVDLIGVAVVTNNNDNIRVWLNDGNGVFTNATSPGSQVVFPDNGSYQRMSADVIDMDNDGDLDFYVTGADGSGVFGFGAVANQFWENRAFGMSLNPVGTNCPGPITLEGRGATPGATVILVRGTTLQPRELGPQSPCPGLRLGLQGFNVFSVRTADASGDFSFTANAPAQLCGQFIQAFELASCSSTSVDSLPQ
jgi:hypothetical protein